MNEHKIIFTGSLGAGKTTAIASISDIPVTSTYVRTLDFARIHASDVVNRNSVVMDYGELNLANGKKLRFYATPGQQRFDYMWKTLIQSAEGLVIFINNAGTDPIGDLARYTDIFREYILNIKTIIAITHTDIVPRPNVQIYQNYLYQLGTKLPVCAVDARSGKDVAAMLQLLG
jgi:uncharacterized protein